MVMGKEGANFRLGSVAVLKSYLENRLLSGEKRLSDVCYGRRTDTRIMRRLRLSAVETGPRDAPESLHALAAALRWDMGVLGAAAQAAEQKPARSPPRRPAPPKSALGLQANAISAKADILFLMSDYQQ
jgi:hypothetical protein